MRCLGLALGFGLGVVAIGAGAAGATGAGASAGAAAGAGAGAAGAAAGTCATAPEAIPTIEQTTIAAITRARRLSTRDERLTILLPSARLSQQAPHTVHRVTSHGL